MPLTLDTPILGTRPGFDPGIILGRMNEPDSKDRAFFVALMTWCRVAQVDPAVPAAQFLLETNNGQSIRWNRDLNASGMGIVSDGTAQPFVIRTPDESARLFVQCLYALVMRERHPEIPLEADVERWFNRVWLPKVQSRAMPVVTKVADLGLRYIENGDSRATWSWEKGTGSMDAYGVKLGSRLAQFYPNLPPRDIPVEVPSTPEEPIPEEGEPMAELVFGNVPFPKHTKAYVYKRPGAGYTQASTRRNIVGMAFHEWMGVGSLEFHKTFFACQPSGQCPSGYVCAPGGRCADALTDAFVMKDGTLVLMNDAWGTRIPWATGGSGPYRGDGAAFATRFGSAGFNSRLFSIEVVKLTNENYTAAQIETLAQISAFVHDNDGQRWDEHPYTSKYGVVVDILHFEAAATSCGENELDDVTKVQARAKQIMRSYQEQITVPDPIPPDVPEQPVPDLPGGADPKKASAAFGSLRRVNTINDTITTGHGFDPGGPISIESTRLAVAAFGLDYSKWPKWEDWYVLNDSGKTLQIVTFSNDWRLVNPAERAGWSLMGFQEEIAA